MKYTKLVITLMGVVLLTACAKQQQPLPPQPPAIPIVLVNIEKNVIVAVPDQPSTQKLVHIRADDPADEALEDTLDYTKDLKAYANKVTEIALECKAELDDRDERIQKIKQYMILQQRPTIQPVY